MITTEDRRAPEEALPTPPKKARGSMKIRKPKGSKFWWIRFHVNGRRYEESSHSTKFEDAVRLLKIREGDSAKGLPVQPKMNKLTVEEGLAAVVGGLQNAGPRHDCRRRAAHHEAPDALLP
jgi:hypothetical protein